VNDFLIAQMGVGYSKKKGLSAHRSAWIWVNNHDRIIFTLQIYFHGKHFEGNEHPRIPPDFMNG
jgi:hypothetical protein